MQNTEVKSLEDNSPQSMAWCADLSQKLKLLTPSGSYSKWEQKVGYIILGESWILWVEGLTLETIIEKSNIVRRQATVKEEVDPANTKEI